MFKLILFRTASVSLAHGGMSERDARGPEDHDPSAPYVFVPGHLPSFAGKEGEDATDVLGAARLPVQSQHYEIYRNMM